ncbi:hypothetical protein J6590_057657 [Homalodisca vitripennis]|nr:hypothetical protein J6590_057657 [Homalodisca vitripennis]
MRQRHLRSVPYLDGLSRHVDLGGVSRISTINKIKHPERIKQEDNLNRIRARLKCLLVANAFYSVDEFMESCWDN